MTLPGISLSWDTAAVDASNVFIQYNVYRRESGGTYERIKIITTVSTLTWTDYQMRGGVTYEYAVTWLALRGSETVESDKQDPPASTSNTFRNVFLHSVDDPTVFAELVEQSVNVTEDLNVRFHNVWGRSAPTAHIGEKQAATISINAQDAWHDNQAMWDDVRLVVAEQIQGSVLCVRHRGEVYFVQAPSFNRSDRIPTMFTQGVQLVEVHYNEAV